MQQYELWLTYNIYLVLFYVTNLMMIIRYGRQARNWLEWVCSPPSYQALFHLQMR